MITGTVTRLQACVGVVFHLPNTPDLEIEFVIDTGFEGALALPPDAVTALGLHFYQEIDANLANNTDVSIDVYRAIILWKGQEVSVAILSMGKRPLLGTALLAGNELNARFEESGVVTIGDL